MRAAILVMLASSLSACVGADPTTLTTGLNNPGALMVNGSTLLWINDPGKSDSSIESIAVTGGKQTTVLSQANLDGNLATDGTKLFFSFSSPGSDTSNIASCGLDGSGVTTLNSKISTAAQPANHVSAMFVVSGTVYVVGEYPASVNVLDRGPFIFSIPAAGGGETVAVPMGSDPVSMVATTLTALYQVDSSGIYFAMLTSPADPSQSDTSVYSATLAGGSLAKLYTVPFTSPNPGIPSAGALTVVGSSAFFLSDDNSANTALLFSAPITGGTATKLATFSNQDSAFIVGDSNTLFIDNQVQSNKPGILSVTLSGTETSYVQSDHGLSTSVGHERVFALDAKNVYWVAGGFNGGQGTVHAKAR